MDAQNTLRDMLETNLAASENGTLGQVADSAPIEAAAPAAEQDSGAAQRARDEAGRFAAQSDDKATAPDAKADQAPATAADQQAAAEGHVQAALEPAPNRPTTWKKEFLPTWDKINSGIPLTPEEGKKLAAYSAQREKEFASGVSAYRAEATAANEIRSAVEPFMPILQQHNTKVGDWIKTLGTAHQTLVLGTPEQKLQMFANMAQQYGIPLQAVGAITQGAQVDPMVGQIMQQMQDMKNQVASVNGWREQQEQQVLQKELSEFSDASKYPHFDLVRGDMAQLLESGYAQDLKTAYAKAVRMNDDAWQAEQERQAQTSANTAPQALKSDAVAKAKAAAVSPKSTTPSGVARTVDPKDRLSMLSSLMDEKAGSRV